MKYDWLSKLNYGQHRQQYCMKDALLPFKKLLFFKARKGLGQLFLVKRTELKDSNASGFCSQAVLLMVSRC